ncbi:MULTISPECIES: MFS transporter [Streptomycetaceae]|uniref:Major facilitator superfamily MFS_1 n=1 Tax=Streptantibioticus cattleyicolor (strain ATCC 35852 / DSM 46488 / JCM 4925 / NBRC 14057 / NRRL 8057) TaxID=1003195 RepID=F8JVN3_STREN|nr:MULTISPECIES: MFS transporter [Streptomycetaceae]AEW96943.1 major facilitator superfamily MFS_1 [Streptantibioticus cattleyicolor NRRL 8057 = DSM 46488]MYS61415.1 MFS transporter [Streptomyces sp. SID5468]CCB77270.1 putative drug resistance transporter [Streptantibioticus cattleyicolor NRRL 8057 = DSM 46488]
MHRDSAPPAPVRTPAGEPPDHHPVLTLLVACTGFFVITLDVNAVTVALPHIGRELGVGVTALQWVLDAYTLLFAALMLSAGTVSDRFGATRVYAVGLAGFTVMSAACALAPDAAFLIGARAAQGAAAALMLPASLSLIRRTRTDPAERARGFALWTAASGVAVAAGPVAGGVLTQALGWRSIFFLNVPVGVAALAALSRTPRIRPRPAPLDGAGQSAVVLALAALVFAVIEGGATGFGSPEVAVASAVAVAAGTAFLAVEARVRHPAVPPALFRERAVAVCTAAGLTMNLGFYGAVFVLSMFFQTQRHLSALVGGVMFLPMTGLIAVVNVVSGRVIARYGPRLPLAAGQLLAGAASLALPAVGPGTPVPLLSAALLPLGVGAGLAAPALTTTMLEAVPAERSGLASGVLNAARQTGGAVGVALFGAFIGGGRFLPGMRLSLLTGGVALLCTGTAVAVLLRGDGGRRRPAVTG